MPTSLRIATITKKGKVKSNMRKLHQDVIRVKRFKGEQLSKQLSAIETSLINKNRNLIRRNCKSYEIDKSLLESAIYVKKISGQINEIIHAVGILILLSQILEKDEIIKKLSLGAGNTGSDYDLETDRRVAEFKFVDWKGGAEALRQNSVFKDFFKLAEVPGRKRRCLYVLGTEYPIKFLQSDRAIKNVLSKNVKLYKQFERLYSSKFEKVCEYYNFRKHEVEILDIYEIMPSFPR